MNVKGIYNRLDLLLLCLINLFFRKNYNVDFKYRLYKNNFIIKFIHILVGKLILK
ncbi:hypothetical protein PROVRUST_05025 [Providencia rustigianii DSM 4541]|uniref:Uncharacterized protein n=1 Tax=Providencia rustigianii DSM 4541 TaxID=500637 RepID=D1NZ55_9GAMM|nr:hypothetical protein PROVRUST_05025 [Providencia rustigianii DSM 4541]